MIEFVTLLLGLVTGPRAVEVAVGPEVASVEILLDGQAVGTLRAEPWTLTCDFGSELAPHELVAVARDAQQRELGRARQRINLPRPAAEARFAVEQPDERGPPRVRLVWESMRFDQPREVVLTFDGEPVEVEDFDHIRLPRYDPDEIHLLHAELFFSNTVEAHAELVLGGRFGSRVDAELTALLVASDASRPPPPEKMAGWFLRQGRPLRVAAVEPGAADLVVVRERSVATVEGLDALYRERREYKRLKLTNRDRMRFVIPDADRRDRPGLEVHLLPVSRDVADYGEGYLLHILALSYFPGELNALERQPLADAVAIAGITAAAGNRRRVVLLVHSGLPADSSLYQPDNVQGFLRQLGVPLHVWSVTPAEELDSPSPWRDQQDVSTPPGYRRAISRLCDDLDSQLVVWLEGSVRAEDVELAPEAGVRLLN